MSNGRSSRRRRQRVEVTPDEPRNLETPEAALARAFLSRQLIPSRGRIDARASEARKFEQWRVRPTPPHKSSCIVKDDRDHFSEMITGNVTDSLVFDHALFPAMSAAENLTTVVSMIDQWDALGKTRLSSLIALCRSSIESSARTIWILSPLERDERRLRALRVTRTELKAKKKYLDERVRLIDAGYSREPKSTRNRLALDRDTCEDLAFNVLVDVPYAKTLEQTIECAAKWIDENAPIRQAASMAPSSLSHYAIASGISHGYVWSTNYVRTATDMMNMVADFLYAATTSLSAAVVLYEAQASGSATIGPRCPAHLRTVVSETYARYSV